jgi:DNA-binding beta-propeller fold protein YncE
MSCIFKAMKKLFFALSITAALQAGAQQDLNYKVTGTYHIQSPGGWDYISTNKGRVYVSHGTQVNVLSAQNGDSLGAVFNTPGVHGIAFDNERNLGFTSDGRANKVTVFDLKTLAPVAEVTTGQNPDAIMYEPFTKTIITCNGRSKDLSLIDPKANTVVATIALSGRPEEAASDGKGRLFVNLEDKSEIAVVDLKKKTEVANWKLAPGEGPTGLSYDRKYNRLFAGCDKLLVVLNADNGAIVDKIKIGDGCDGVAFDAKKRIVYTSNGEGTLSVIKQLSADKYQLLGNVPTKRGARTIALDENAGKIFMPTADFEAPAKQGERPHMVQGSFQVIVVQPVK